MWHEDCKQKYKQQKTFKCHCDLHTIADTTTNTFVVHCMSWEMSGFLLVSWHVISILIGQRVKTIKSDDFIIHLMRWDVVLCLCYVLCSWHKHRTKEVTLCQCVYIIMCIIEELTVTSNSWHRALAFWWACVYVF